MTSVQVVGLSILGFFVSLGVLSLLNFMIIRREENREIVVGALVFTLIVELILFFSGAWG